MIVEAGASPPIAAPVDWSRLDELLEMETAGMPGLTARLVCTFVQNSQRLLGELQAAMDAGDADGVRRAAHSIKSTSANVGGTPLAQVARTLEHAAQKSAWLPEQADVDRIVAEHQRLLQALSERFALV